MKTRCILIFISLLLAVSFASAACTNNTYSGSGDWIMNSTNSPNVCSDMTITMNGNLNVYINGNLTFNNITLFMNNSVDQQYKINVDRGFFDINSSNFSAINKHYVFSVDYQGILYANRLNITGTNQSGANLLSVTGGSAVASINNSYIGKGVEYYPFYAAGVPTRVDVENTTILGGGYDVRIISVSPGKVFFKNNTWGQTNNRIYISGAHLMCSSCTFPESRITGVGEYSIYSKNHKRFTNQSIVFGTGFNFSNSLGEEYLVESNKSLIFYDSSSKVVIEGGTSVTFENISVISNSPLSNSNYLKVLGTLNINQSNSTIQNIAFYGGENVVAQDGLYLFQKFGLNVKAQWQGNPIENVNLSIYDNLNKMVYTELTASTGYITLQNITVLHVNSTGVTYFNNFTINSSEINEQNYSEIINLTSYRFITVPHDYCDFPVTGTWTINDENKFCEDRHIAIVNGNINITSGFNLTIINSTLNFSLTNAGAYLLSISSNAYLILNNSNVSKEGLPTASLYISSDYGGNIRYYDSFFSSTFSHTYFVTNNSFYAHNTTFGKLPGYSNAGLVSLQFRALNNTLNTALINRSKIYGYFSFYTSSTPGNIEVNVLDSDCLGVVSYSVDPSSDSKVIINNTVDMKVLDNNLQNDSGEQVKIYDEYGNLIYLGTADSFGEINSIPLTYRIINRTSDYTKNYTLSANQNNMSIVMGIPKTKYNGRQVVIGTYNQNYEEKLSRVPYLYDFGFTITDDADTFDYENGNETYTGFYNAGFLATPTQWAWNDSFVSWNNFGLNDSAENLAWYLDLKSKGFELGLHSTTETDDWRNETLLGFDIWNQLIGFPIHYIEHSSNREHLIDRTGADPTSLYYLLDLVNTSNISYYWVVDDLSDNGRWRDVPENSSSWYNGWKAYEPSIDPITGESWSNGETSLFPNYTNPKAILPLNNTAGTPINLTSMIGKFYIRDNAQLSSNGLYPLYSSSHIFDLQETKDLTIHYTHSGSFSQFDYTLQEIARYDGWFTTAGEILDYSKKLEKVSIIGGDKTFTVTNNGDSEIEGIVVYPDTNGTIIGIPYANTSDGLYLLSVGLNEDEMMLPPLGPGESITVEYSLGGSYISSIPKISNISNENVELRNAVYNYSTKITDFKIGLDRITTYNSTNSSLRWTNITVENLNSGSTYTLLRDGEQWTNYSIGDGGETLHIWTFLSEHNFTMQELQPDGSTCTYAESCFGGYCNSGICASGPPSDNQDSSNSAGTATYHPSEKVLEEGYSRTLRQKDRVEFSFGSVIVKSIDYDSKEVVLSISGEDYLILEGSSVKIDTNNDGYYDTEINVKSITFSNYANIEFKSIYEEIPKEEAEEQKENIIEKIPEIVKKIKWYRYIIGAGIVVLVVGFVFLRRKINNIIL